jgi:hypothetical protein
MPTRAWVGWRRARAGRIVAESFILGVLLELFFGVDGLMGSLGCDLGALYSHCVEVAFIPMGVHSLVVVVLYQDETWWRFSIHADLQTLSSIVWRFNPRS